MLQMVSDVGDGDSLEIVDLAARENGGYDFVFLGGGEDEYGVGRRLLKGFEESVERRS